MFGHNEEQYRKKAPHRKERREWRVKEICEPRQQEQQDDSNGTDEGDGFQRIAPRHTIRTPIGRNIELTAETRTNSF